MNFKTPKGTLGWAKLFRPDTKFKADGEYSTQFTMPLDEKAQELIDSVQEGFSDEFGNKAVKTGHFPWTINEEDNTVTFKFKSKYKPKVFDTEGELDESCKLGSGTIARVAGKVRFVEAGGKKYASMNLQQVKVIELVTYSAGGFDDEEDEDEPAPKKAQVEDTGASKEDDEDF